MDLIRLAVVFSAAGVPTAAVERVCEVSIMFLSIIVFRVGCFEAALKGL
jgi:hypothetical protein